MHTFSEGFYKREDFYSDSLGASPMQSNVNKKAPQPKSFFSDFINRRFKTAVRVKSIVNDVENIIGNDIDKTV